MENRFNKANEARLAKSLIRRAPFLAAVQSGMPLREAREIYGISKRAASRYMAEVGQ